MDLLLGGEMEKIKLILSMIPPSVNGIWINKPNGRYKSPKGKQFEKLANLEIKNQYKGKPINNQLKISINLFFKDKRKRDIDNYNKGILDAMTGIIYQDDSQIEELHVFKKIGCGFDKVEISIEEMIYKTGK